MTRNALGAGCTLALLVGMWAMPGDAGYVAVFAWAMFSSAAFAFTVAFRCGWSAFCVSLTVVVATFAAPAVALVLAARPYANGIATSMAKMTAAVAAGMPLQGFEILLPIASACVSLMLARKVLATRESSLAR